jgi:hypothetical protein
MELLHVILPEPGNLKWMYVRYERQTWYSMAQAGNLETERGEGGNRENQTPPMHGGEGKVHLLCTEVKVKFTL